MAWTFQGPKRQVPRDTNTPQEQFVQRLRQLGATDEEVAAVEVTWDDPDGWDPDRDTVLRLDDEDLRARIIDARVEYLEHTTLPDPDADLAGAATVAVRGTIAEVLAWVDADPLRAAAALDAERAKHPQERTTLLSALEARIPG